MMKKSYFGIFLLLLLVNNLNSQTLPANMFPDVNAPFIHGVASGDPTVDAVIIWTRVEPDSLTQVSLIHWEVATNQDFSSIVSSGTKLTDGSKDWTIKVDVTGLNQHSQYFFRFYDTNGNYSVVGRTRTAPDGAIPHSRLGIMSCSSVYSGFFNAYRRLAERTDLDMIIHVGDYLYDFVDEDEEVRLPTPYPSDPITLEEWRNRHKFYLLDPDLREARRMHPWVVLWDNHDIDFEIGHETAPFVAFHEYIPIRMPDTLNINQIHRKISYGSLLDIFVVDIEQYQNVDSLVDGEPSMMGISQYQWLTNELSSSNATWKLLPMQKLMSGWSVIGIPSWIGLGSSVLDDGNWDGFDAERDMLLNFLSQNSINNVVALSGDSHITVFGDLCVDPYDGNLYDPSTGSGSVAVEMLPTSISRGNFDEMGFGWAVPIVEPILMNANPNYSFTELTEHGYGILDIRSDSCVGEVWYSGILNLTNTETFGRGHVVLKDENHWQRSPRTSPTPPKDITSLGIPFYSSIVSKSPNVKIFPNPTTHLIQIVIETNIGQEYLVEIFTLTGSRTEIQKSFTADHTETTLDFDLSSLTQGTFLVCVRQKGDVNCTSVMVVR